MYIKDCFRDPARSTFSLELMPCRTPEAAEALLDRFEASLSRLPDFVSVTHSLDRLSWTATLALAARCQERWRVPAMVHLAGRDLRRDELGEYVRAMRDFGIETVLALRGDVSPERPLRGDFRYASELIEALRAEDVSLSIAGACYPLGHPEAIDLGADLQALVTKVSAGVDFLVTQLYLDAPTYASWHARVRASGVAVPILPGVIAPRDRAHLERLCRFCRMTVDVADDITFPDAFLALGREALTMQAPGLHVFTLNQVEAACVYADLFVHHPTQEVSHASSLPGRSVASRSHALCDSPL